jgi:hypothetical protein
MEKLTPRDTGKGVAETFTGNVYIDNIVAPQPPSRMVVTAVGFTPGARTHWHSHALGQVLRTAPTASGSPRPATASSSCCDPVRLAGRRQVRPRPSLTLLTRRRSAVLARLAPRLRSSGAAVPAAARGEQ